MQPRPQLPRMTYAMLLPAQTLTLTGADAVSFAQAQFSSDINSLEPGRWQWSAWLSAKGRVRALMHVARTNDDTLLVLLRGGHAEAMAADLKRFVFRSKVVITALPVRALVDAPPLAEGNVVIDATGIVLGFGSYAFVIRDEQGPQTWRAHAVEEGHPWLDDAHLDAFLPPALSLERLHGVSFNKGCFPGQEIVARLHYLGGNKQHLYKVRATTPLTDGLALSLNGKQAAVVLNSVQANDAWIALSVMHDDTSKDADHATVSFDDGAVVLTLEQAWGS